MNWYMAICLLIAALCVPAFLLIVRAMVREIWRPRRRIEEAVLPEEPQSALPDIDERTATLMFQHSFVATMIDRYQDMGAPGDVIDFINRELSTRSSGWRVRALPDGNGEFYDLEAEKPRRWLLGSRRSRAA